MDQPRGTSQVRDAALGGGAGASGRAIAATSAATRAVGSDYDWSEFAPADVASINDRRCHKPVVLIVLVHVAMPAAAQESLDVLHQHRHGTFLAS